MPTFQIIIADYPANTTGVVKQPRAVFYDIYTSAGSIYSPMIIKVEMPQIGTNILYSASICRVKLVYTGINSMCILKEFINSNNIEFTS